MHRTILLFLGRPCLQVHIDDATTVADATRRSLHLPLAYAGRSGLGPLLGLRNRGLDLPVMARCRRWTYRLFLLERDAGLTLEARDRFIGGLDLESLFPRFPLLLVDPGAFSGGAATTEKRGQITGRVLEVSRTSLLLTDQRPRLAAERARTRPTCQLRSRAGQTLLGAWRGLLHLPPRRAA